MPVEVEMAAAAAAASKAASKKGEGIEGVASPPAPAPAAAAVEQKPSPVAVAVASGGKEWWRGLLGKGTKKEAAAAAMGDADTDVHLLPLEELEARMGVKVKEGLTQVCNVRV